MVKGEEDTLLHETIIFTCFTIHLFHFNLSLRKLNKLHKGLHEGLGNQHVDQHADDVVSNRDEGARGTKVPKIDANRTTAISDTETASVVGFSGSRLKAL